MSKHMEVEYLIEELFIVEFNSECIKELERRGLDANNLFILEKFCLKKGKDLPYYYETYKEAITNFEIYHRQGEDEFSYLPYFIKQMEPLPFEYLTKEERDSGKITSVRVFEIYRKINQNRIVNQEVKSNDKTYKKGKKKWMR